MKILKCSYEKDTQSYENPHDKPGYVLLWFEYARAIDGEVYEMKTTNSIYADIGKYSKDVENTLVIYQRVINFRGILVRTLCPQPTPSLETTFSQWLSELVP